MRDDRSVLAEITDVIGGLAGRVIFISLLVLAMYLAVTKSFSLGHSLFYQEAVDEPPGNDVTVTVEEGMGVDSLAKMLMEKGIINNELAFRVQGRLYRTGIYPGTYELNTSLTTKEILGRLDTSQEEYEIRLEKKAAAENEVMGEASELVDEEQLKAAAAQRNTGDE